MRGGCGFLAKVQWAQRRGALAVIVGDDVRGGALVRMYARGDTSNTTIPSLFTSHTTAHLLSSLLSSHATLPTPPVSPHGTPPPEAQGLPHPGRFHALLSALKLTTDERLEPPRVGSRRIPGSGRLAWAEASDRDGGQNRAPPAESSNPVDPFVIGEHDWRDPDLLPSMPSARFGASATVAASASTRMQTAGIVLPGSGEYSSRATETPRRTRWWRSSPRAELRQGVSSPTDNWALDTTSAHIAEVHKGLWVTLTPTSVSTSPFFDTLLVLVVSPLVTLTVVYALLLLRSRIRRRRWRAPKSVVERLPVRTYQTISEASSSPTPGASSPTTPLLQRSSTPSPSSVSRPCSRRSSDAPATSSSANASHDRTEEKHESGLAAWRRRYGGRQKECVVCLDEYEDGVSQVMSLPCGHEFHADCM